MATATTPHPPRSKDELYKEFKALLSRFTFTADFNSSLEALMHDKLATVGQRVMAWGKRYSWGNYSPYCIGNDGRPLFQRDCCAELGLHKSQVSRTIQYYADRGYIELRGKLIFFIIEVQLKPLPDKATDPDSYVAFCERWKVANSSDSQELEVAEAVVKRIKTSRLSAYRKSLTPGKSAGPSLLQIERSPEPDSESSSSAVDLSPCEGKADEEEAAPVVQESPETAALQVAEPKELPGTWETFTKLYPPDHLDGPKARPLFAAFKLAQKKRCIARLLVYLSSDRWKKSPQYIPLASNWLKSAYEEPPPPFYEAGGKEKKGFTEGVMEEALRRFNKWGEVL